MELLRWFGLSAVGRSLARGALACEIEAEEIADQLMLDDKSCPGSGCALGPEGGLPADLCQFFSDRLGYDFGSVRVHVGEQASAVVARAGALAFTVGNDIFFGAGRYQPDTDAGLRLLAHELVHVIQQGAATGRGTGDLAVRRRSPRTVQCQSNVCKVLSKFFAAVCPPDTKPQSYPSSGPIGTAYGNWLGTMYMIERAPKTYGLVDFTVYWGSPERVGSISQLWQYDPGVALAMKYHEYTRYGLERTDILDSDLDEVYEIKPILSAAAGPPQLAGYLAALKRHAQWTSDLFGPPRRRLWDGGNWDPSCYPLIVPGARGQVCMIHAWRDSSVRGLILYDLVCCVPTKQPEQQPVLYDTKINQVVQELKHLQLVLQAMVADRFAKAPRGSRFAVLATPRFFETFVIGPWERQIEKMYGTRVGPVHKAFILELFMVAHILTGPIADAVYVETGYLTWEQVSRLWEAQALAAIVAAPAAAGIGIVGEYALGLLSMPVVGEGVAAELSGLAAVTEEAIPAIRTTSQVANEMVEVGEQLLVEAEGGATTVVSPGLPPWMISPLSAGGGIGTGIGLGVIGAFVTGAALFSADAKAETPPGSKAPAQNSGQSGSGPPAQIIGKDPVYAAPIELIVPKRGTIEIGAEVTFGGEKYFIIALGSAGGT